MALKTVELSVIRCLEANIIKDEFTIVWHAGEPLVLGIDYYQKAFKVIRDILPGEIKVNHSFQTNGVLINEDWCQFFKNENIRLGLSIDGPKEIHDKHRRYRDGRGSHDQVQRALDLLNFHNVPFHIIAVLTREALQHADNIFDFFTQNQVSHLCFNVEEVEGIHTQSSLLSSDFRCEFEAFFRRIYVRLSQYKSPLFIREIHGPINAILAFKKNKKGNLVSQEAFPFKIISIDAQGNLSTFSPELLGQRNNSRPFYFGNVYKDKLGAVVKSTLFEEISKEISLGVEKCRDECAYFDLCGGGSPSNKLAENGSFASSETQFCRIHKQACVDLALEILENDTVNKRI